MIRYIFNPMIPEPVHRPAFRCLGLEAEGPLVDPAPWVGRLWGQFWRRSSEIGLRGSCEAWGLMSDMSIHLAPWGGERGRYLASVEVPEGTEARGDWKLWTIPAMTWMHLPCRMDRIAQTVDQARSALQRHPEWCWEGSVHERYPAGFGNPATDEFDLVFGLMPR